MKHPATTRTAHLPAGAANHNKAQTTNTVSTPCTHQKENGICGKSNRPCVVALLQSIR